MGDGGITQVKAQTQLKRRSNATGVKAQPKQFRTQGNAEQIKQPDAKPDNAMQKQQPKTQLAEQLINNAGQRQNPQTV